MASLLELATKALEAVVRVVPDRDPDELRTATRCLGQPVARVDGRLKVTGTAPYTAETALPELTHAALVHSRIAKGIIAHLDTAAAAAAPGVLAVLTHQNAPRLQPAKLAFAASLLNPLAAAATTRPILQSPAISWNGEIVAVVVAETPEQAAAAATLVQVEYAAETPALSLAAHKGRAFIPNQVALHPAELSLGDADQALATAAVRVDQVYTTPAESCNALEPHATVAAWDGPDQLTVYDTTQYPSGTRDALAEAFQLQPEQVRVRATYIGGGFGGKAATYAHTILAAAAARLVGRPVKLVLPRAAVNHLTGARSPTEQRVALGATAEGQLTALLHTGYSMCTQDVFAEQFTIPARHLYAAPPLRVGQQVVPLDLAQNSFMRAPGEAPGMFALESAMDELAQALPLDPVELRLRNEPTQDPTDGAAFSSRHLRECYARGAGRFGWQLPRPAPGTTRVGDWLVGTGVAAAYYPAQQLLATVRTRLDAAGVVTVRTATSEMGVGAATVQAQHIAERFGVALENARYEQGDSDLPTARVMGGSAATATVGAAIRASAEQLTDALLKLARRRKTSALYRARRAEVELRSGGLYRQDAPAAGETFATLLGWARQPFIEVEGTSTVPYEALKYTIASYGAHFCEVRVHARTREVRVTRFVSVVDCGRVLNPRTAASQIQGGIVMGLGMALMEETVVDPRSGRVLTPDLTSYHVPVQADVPAIEVEFIDRPDPQTPLGAKSVGEVGITGVAAAVANAVFHATGIRVRDLPITVDKLL